MLNGADPAMDAYAAATSPARNASEGGAGAVLIDRSGRTRILIEGRSPGRMLHGLVTGTIPADPVAAAESLVLTPKGKIVADLRLVRLEAGEEGSFLVELPAAGAEPLLAHLARYLPPRFARPTDISDRTRMLTLVGPGAPDVLEAALGAALPDGGSPLEPPGAARMRGSVGGGDLLVAVRSSVVAPPAFDLIGSPEALAPIEAALVTAGAAPAAPGLWRALRIERGIPETGEELDDTILPHEAGLEWRAIDHKKGCYTGQEVVVRIRDRGRVNRLLRGLVLVGDSASGALPEPGTPIFAEGREREVGALRSAVFSPRAGRAIALAYLRREIEPGTEVRIGAVDGPIATVHALTAEGWEPPLESRDATRIF